MSNRLVCPKCGCVRFIRTCTDEIEIYDNKDTIVDMLIKPLDYKYVCKKCKTDVTEEELMS